MTAIAGTVTGFRSMADGTVQLRINMNEQESRQAMKLLCEVGAAVGIARLMEPGENAICYTGLPCIPTPNPDAPGRTQDPSPDDDEASEGKALYGQEARELRLSGMFLRPDVWKAVGSDAQFLKWLTTQPCAARRLTSCQGDIVAAHVRRIANGAGTGIKPEYSAIPLCWKHHTEQHRSGELTFGGREWFDKKRIDYVQAWCWAEMKRQLDVSHMNDASPDKVRSWAYGAGILHHLPECYRNA